MVAAAASRESGHPYRSAFGAAAGAVGGRDHAYRRQASALPDAAREQRSWQVRRAGIDFRGDGGYIIVPPSLRMIDGYPMSYESKPLLVGWSHHWQRSGCATSSTLARRPCLPRNRRGLAAESCPARLAVARRPEGERNLGWFKAACRVDEHGHSPREALDALGPASGESGLGNHEITRIVGSAYRQVRTYGTRSACSLTARPCTCAPTIKASDWRIKRSPTASRSAKTKGRRSSSLSRSPPSHQHRLPPMSGVLVHLKLWS